jgi:hypothetical protein
MLRHSAPVSSCHNNGRSNSPSKNISDRSLTPMRMIWKSSTRACCHLEMVQPVPYQPSSISQNTDSHKKWTQIAQCSRTDTSSHLRANTFTDFIGIHRLHHISRYLVICRVMEHVELFYSFWWKIRLKIFQLI